MLRRRRQPWCPRWWGRRRRSRRSRGPPVGIRDGAGVRDRRRRGRGRRRRTRRGSRCLVGDERFVGFTVARRRRLRRAREDLGPRGMYVPWRPRRRCACGRSARGFCGEPVDAGAEVRDRGQRRCFAYGNSSDRVPNPRTWRWEKCRADARLLTLRMPLDQIALLSFTSTRTSEVFMTFCANFFTCWRRGRGGGERGCSGKKDSSPREREAGEPGPRWADGNDPSPGDARHRSSRTASRCPIHNVNDRTPRRSGEPTVVTRVDAASRASHRRLALIAARLSRGWALTACTARGALFLKVSPWTALARLMVYSRVTTS